MADPTPQAKVVVPFSDERWQQRAAREFAGEFSHEDDLPLKIRTRHSGWWGRTISVTTLEPIWYRDAILHIEVPAGFTYDLASIPRFVWPIVSPYDIALEATFHDLFYRCQQISRRMADQIFLSMMQQRDVPFAIRWSVYLAVRFCGGRAWRMRAAQMGAALSAAAHQGQVTGKPVDVPSALASDLQK